MRNHTMNKIFLLCLFVIGFCTCFAFADDLSGGQGAAFLRIPVGARSAGLGNAYTAIADDASAPFYNPAGLCQIEGTRIGAMYNIMSFDRINYQASIILASRYLGSVALTVNNYLVGDIIEVLPGQEPSGNTFDSNDIALGLSVARQIIPFLNVGVGAKFVSQSLYENKATGFCFDLGTFFTAPLSGEKLKRIRAGASLLNIGGKMNWDTDSDHEDDIYPMLRIGTAADIKLNYIDMVGTVEISQVLGRASDEDKDFEVHIGVEGALYKNFAIRTGLENKDFSMGASVSYQNFRFDYAFCPDFLDEGDTHKLAVEMSF